MAPITDIIITPATPYEALPDELPVLLAARWLACSTDTLYKRIAEGVLHPRRQSIYNLIPKHELKPLKMDAQARPLAPSRRAQIRRVAITPETPWRDLPELLTISDAARWIGCERPSLSHQIMAGVVPVVGVSPRDKRARLIHKRVVRTLKMGTLGRSQRVRERRASQPLRPSA